MKKEKKKKKRDCQKLRLKSDSGSLHVVLFTEMLLSYELRKCHVVFSVSITHKSKIRELSDENKVIEIELWWCQTNF